MRILRWNGNTISYLDAFLFELFHRVLAAQTGSVINNHSYYVGGHDYSDL